MSHDTWLKKTIHSGIPTFKIPKTCLTLGTNAT